MQVLVVERFTDSFIRCEGRGQRLSGVSQEVPVDVLVPRAERRQFTYSIQRQERQDFWEGGHGK